LLFRGLCEVLIHSLSGQVSVDSRGGRLNLWESTVELLNGLLIIVQQVEQPRNFGLFLKHSLLFLKLLLQRGMSALEAIVRDDPERLTRFLHELQKVTRFLHQLCCHYLPCTSPGASGPISRRQNCSIVSCSHIFKTLNT